MKYEYRAYYQRNVNTAPIYDEEVSNPVQDITIEDAEKLMQILEFGGFKRHETKSQIFFDKRTDSNHSFEHIFYK